jgi:hypothetical protein
LAAHYLGGGLGDRLQRPGDAAADDDGQQRRHDQAAQRRLPDDGQQFRPEFGERILQRLALARFRIKQIVRLAAQHERLQPHKDPFLAIIEVAADQRPELRDQVAQKLRWDDVILEISAQLLAWLQPSGAVVQHDAIGHAHQHDAHPVLLGFVVKPVTDGAQALL